VDQLERFNSVLNRGLAFMAGCSLVAMMLVTVGEMVLRMFGRPMAGTVETIGWLAAITTAFALGYGQIYKSHVAIDLFTNRLTPRTRVVVSMAVYLASTALFWLVSWRVFRYAGVLKQSGSLSETMKVIVYPWVYMVSLGCAGLSLALLVDFLKTCRLAFSSGAAGKG
jgi:TRAP-type C4-dicarboxylate transport system permease small subunit